VGIFRFFKFFKVFQAKRKLARYNNRMESFKRSWRNVPSGVRKPLVLIIGSLIVIAGIIFLPLPGPGWVIIFAGFALLATEFTFAERVQDWLVQIFKIGAYYLRKAWNGIWGRPTHDGVPKFKLKNNSYTKH
jgi:uncharacterized protein (TIGR02611 family)